jgi:osmotically inducible protein OsmC
MPVSTARAQWSGSLFDGKGSVEPASGAFGALPLTWENRADKRPAGSTSPEELIAAAHAGCFSMAFSNMLAKNGTPPEHLAVEANVEFDTGGAGPRVSSSELRVTGVVPGIDAATFDDLAAEARDGCPVSKALTGNVDLSVHSTLEAS